MKNPKQTFAAVLIFAQAIAFAIPPTAPATAPDHQDYSEPEPWYVPPAPVENSNLPFEMYLVLEDLSPGESELIFIATLEREESPEEPGSGNLDSAESEGGDGDQK